MKIKKEEYNKAVGCLKRYNYNCINIINIQEDILSISVPQNDGLPRAPYSVSDVVFNKVVQLQDNEELNESLTEYKAVVQALQLLDKDSKYIFEKEFREKKNKWQIISDMNVSEETYKRRKHKLIYAVDRELKKMT